MAARKRVVWSHPIRTDSLELGFIRLVRPVIFYFYGLTPRRQRLLLATGLFWREKDGALGFGIKPGFVFDGASVPRRSDLATYRIAVGKRHKVAPGAIVGAIANEGGLHRSDFGHITIKVDHSLVELPAKLTRQTVKALEHTRIQGQLIHLEPERGPKARRKSN